jgi:hypothetical protein
MVAYSFQRRFVAPICLGLGRDIPDGFEVGSGLAEQEPKTHTIRRLFKINKPEERRRHARPGELVQLYYGQRTKSCLQLGVARCTDALGIFINVGLPNGGPYIRIEGRDPFVTARELDAFARSDGFGDFGDMRDFWTEHHRAIMNNFRGVIVFWERIT